MSTDFALNNLIIQNFATFTSQQIEFTQGFNAIIGETGSGKSLVMDALSLLLGARADKRFVRAGAEQAIVEARFHCRHPTITKELSALGFPLENDELIIKRVIQKNGTSRSYINHFSCTGMFISQFMKKYIDLVGQFENQKLLSDDYLLEIIDSFSEHRDLLAEYKKNFDTYRELSAKKKELIEYQQTRNQKIDFLSFQLQEINQLSPSSQDEEYLLRLKEKFLSFEKRKNLNQQIDLLIHGNDEQDGLSQLISKVSSLTFKNQTILSPLNEPLRLISDSLSDFIKEKDQLLTIEDEILSFDEIMSRLDIYQKLKKKYGGNVESILEQKTLIEDELNELEQIEHNLQGIDPLIEQKFRQITDLSSKLHSQRQKSVVKINKLLTDNVRKLKMNGATIDIHLTESSDFNDYGKSNLHFHAQTNPGGGFHPVKEIASGGELSRILLSLRQCLSQKDSISVFLFDEIDTGIGGETAIAVGKALMDVADKGQVIAITHLPQIAQFASQLISVKKEVKQDSTVSKVTGISGKEIKKEISQMLQLN